MKLTSHFASKLSSRRNRQEGCPTRLINDIPRSVPEIGGISLITMAATSNALSEEDAIANEVISSETPMPRDSSIPNPRRSMLVTQYVHLLLPSHRLSICLASVW